MTDKKTVGKPKVGDGTPGPGRPPGKANKTTALLKDAILLAAEAVGEDGAGKGGLTGYLGLLARSEPKAFAALLGRVLPLQITGEGDDPLALAITVRYASPSPRD
jgi:hypothetical protein